MTFKFPEKVHKVEVLNCNNNCSVCPIVKRKDLTAEDLKKMITAGIGQNDILLFNQGELAIRNDFFELINFSRKQGFRLIWLETNGRIFYYPEFVSKIDKLGIDKFIIKFYSHKKDIHEKIAQVPGSFSQTLGGIKNLRNSHKYVAIKLILNQDNCDDLPEIVEFLAGLKVREIDFWLSSDLIVEKIASAVKAAENICANYQIISRRLNWPLDDLAEISLNQSEKEIEDKIRSLWENNINYLDLKLRQEIFGAIKLVDILQYLAKYQQAIFHSSSRQFPVLLPQQGKASYSHGNFLAVYAQDDPWESIFRAVIDRSGFFACKKNGSQSLFFAEKKNRENLLDGYIHILPKQNFLYSCHEYFTFGNVAPLFIFQASHQDFSAKIQPYPFIETRRPAKLGLFADYERDIIREICLSKYQFDKPGHYHTYEHIYRVSELAFILAQKECPDFANAIFIGACLHDVARADDSEDKKHGSLSSESAQKIISQYFLEYLNSDVLQAIEFHALGQTSSNPVIGCLWDADRLDLWRLKVVPDEKLLSTQSAKDYLALVLQANDGHSQNIFDNWVNNSDYFRKFLGQSKHDFLPNKFFKKIKKNKFSDLAKLINDNYAGLGKLQAVFKYVKHSCNRIHIFVFAEKKVIIKFTDKVPAEINWEIYLMSLAKKTINVPEILLTKTGAPYLTYKNKSVILTEFIPSQNINFQTLKKEVISLLYSFYCQRQIIAREYNKLLPEQFAGRLKKMPVQDFNLIKDKQVIEILNKNWIDLTSAWSQKESFVPGFKGLQVVGYQNNNCFLGTEHLADLYAPLAQVAANYIVNLVFLSDQIYSQDELRVLINEFVSQLPMPAPVLDLKTMVIFMFWQYNIFLIRKNKEEKSFGQKWANLLVSLKELYKNL